MLIIRNELTNLRCKLESHFGKSVDSSEVRQTVARVLSDIELRGDEAVRYYTQLYDGADISPEALRVPSRELEAATQSLTLDERAAIEESIGNVREFHLKTLPESWTAKNRHGATVGEVYYPIHRVGCYIPGGQVPLISSVVMTCALGQLVGVPEIVATTPPDPDGHIASPILATLKLCGVDEVYCIGGIQAIGALSHGTASVPAVDKVFGPGNAYVNEAKRQVFGKVGVDLLPGPSEVMIIADSSAEPRFIAADLLAQAEHGTGKERIYLALTEESMLADVNQAIETQAIDLCHGDEIRKILENNFVIFLVDNLHQAAEAANLIAPEHLELQVEDAELDNLTTLITTAGAILQGHLSPTVLGDFTAGPSHTLPTGFSGHSFSGLRATDFMRRSSIVRYDEDSLVAARSTVRKFSSMEKLDAHGRSMDIRFT
ncbi:MAG: histidinol dehydrogenase [Opitutae bacterium]|jgi:histidinol dehydrogenase|nr:histidinol dehydrogenase [Opitutae bacterium]MBT5380295.1 histidinol dehydrogenase [Opitutae bacterium]MBT6463649.1 histidinol dehydrogenase [Opitutae bacterium]MBT6958998.1 histidinol dehydrogenase [Opitutae bacterium]